MEDNDSLKTDIENTSASSERNLTQRDNLEAEPIDIQAQLDLAEIQAKLERAKTQAKPEHAEIQMKQEIIRFNTQKISLEANPEEAKSNI